MDLIWPVEGWELVKADAADACYEHSAMWVEYLDCKIIPLF